MITATAAIKIDPEFQALIPPLSAEERQQLEENLKADGCRDALVVWDDTLIDGHNRYEICTRLGIAYRVEEMVFDSRADVRIWIRRNQKGRRNLSDAWLIELELGNKADLLELGRVKYQETVGRPVKEESLSNNDNDFAAAHVLPTPTPDTKHNTQKEIAKAVGVSTGKVAQAEVVRKKSPELWEKAKQGEVTIGAAYTKVKHEEKRETLAAKLQERTRETTSGKLTIHHADAFTFDVQPQSFDLLLTDPPYSTDVADMDAFIQSWLPKALNGVKQAGRAYIFTGAYPNELRAYLNAIEQYKPNYLRMAQILTWSYRNTIGPSPTHDYKLNWQACFYLVGKDAPRLDCPVMLEQFAAQEINAPDARNDVRYHAWQKPDELAERIIRHATKPGDVVLDLFAGTGTFASAAIRLGRNCVAVEKNADMLDLCERRGLEVNRAS